MVPKWVDKLVADYVRSSVSGEDGQLSVSAQKQMMEQCAAEAGGQVSACYVDERYGGGSIERPALQRLLAAARSGELAIGVVLAYDWSKLCGHFEDFQVLSSLVGDTGVEVFSVSEARTVSSEIVFAGHIIRAYEQFLRDAHRERTRRGIAHARRMRGS